MERTEDFVDAVTRHLFEVVQVQSYRWVSPHALYTSYDLVYVMCMYVVCMCGVCVVYVVFACVVCMCTCVCSILYTFFAGLVVLTALMGYSVASGPLQLESLLWTVLGTGLCSASANSINQVSSHCYCNCAADSHCPFVVFTC